jgi:single-stranded-DNA-specific exonuclease
MAAGLQVLKGNLDAFRQAFNAECAARLAGHDLTPVRRVDAWVRPGEVNVDLWKAMQSMEPFGLGNPTPHFAMPAVRLEGPARRVGKDHLGMTLVSGGSQFDAIGFGMAERKFPEGEADILFQIGMDRFRGRNSIQLKIQDFRDSEGMPPGFR